MIRISDAARSCLSEEAHALKERLDVPARLRGSLKSHPTGWLFGSLASGLAASMLFRRKSSSPPKKARGLPSVLLGLTLTAVRPLAKVWLTDQIKNYVAGHSHPTSLK
ncbi:MAG: hypothetical protein ABI162_15480 [Luteolibacter sp.]